MDALDTKLNDLFDGKVVRKDLVHRIKKGTNVPTFVLEFLLARYCASDDETEIQAGMEAVLETLHDNYVRPNEANKAQSKVATKGKYRFIDKVHVNYSEKDRRHWAALENFDSRKVAISEKFYCDHDRLLQGGLWAEVTIAYNEIEDDDYAFYIEDLRPIQLSRFNFEQYCEGRQECTRDEWMSFILRTVGLEPSKLSQRLKMHFIARLLPLVEPNFNFIELGPRGTGKSYFFSEFSPYSTLISGGQATSATLFYNNQRRKIGLVGFWDVVAFDEVAGIKVKDPDTIQIMKDFMANGRFSRGVEVIADASMAFVGNLDLSVSQIVNSEVYDLFQPLPKAFDLAVMDRFACYLPGWEMPKNSSEFLTNNYGFITDYLAVSRIVKGSVSRINAIRTRSIIAQILVLDVAGTRTYSIHCHHSFFQFPGICIFKVIGCIVTIRYIPPDRTDFISFIIIIRAITFQDNLGFIMVFGNDCFRVIKIEAYIIAPCTDSISPGQ